MIRLYDFDEVRPEEILNRDIRAEADVEATLGSGCDIRHGLIGAGVYASHGYERSHRDGAKNTLMLLIGYLG